MPHERGRQLTPALSLVRHLEGLRCELTVQELAAEFGVCKRKEGWQPR